ncbi:hypothetical protein B0H13DRAFT_1881711 [Mycena leptocephala]|nr:hypothetical protein B0H13DRAFT_1881711 [Mycena leptocephala]
MLLDHISKADSQADSSASEASAAAAAPTQSSTEGVAPSLKSLARAKLRSPHFLGLGGNFRLRKLKTMSRGEPLQLEEASFVFLNTNHDMRYDISSGSAANNIGLAGK